VIMIRFYHRWWDEVFSHLWSYIEIIL
jgi:hypothetical protein